ncbi:MAG: hypothetical protein EA376_12010 [Phycisphaeraceae bacterium]|nr:MAG: hypothetical protein EA376_12010 [Phycisphaeraceae bacterium]
MTVTEKLLRLHRVETQIRGLRKRIDSAQKYLDEQERQLASIQSRLDALATQMRQLKATAHNDENEIAELDARINKLRDQLNTAKTNKEYTALLTEVNTFKADKSAVEDRVLESMTRLDEVTEAVAQLEAEREERSKIRDIAAAERDQRAQEVKDRLEELEKEREVAAAEVPKDTLILLEQLGRRHDEDAMVPIEEHSRRHMEFSCGGCQVLLPMELVSAILGRNVVTQCSSCGAILYMDDSLRESMSTTKR